MRILALASALLVSPGCRGGTSKDRGAEPGAAGCTSSEGWAYVSAGIRLACGVHTDGCAECWGLEGLETNGETGFGAYLRTGEDLPPNDSFASLAVVLDYGTMFVMGNQACGVRTDGSVSCWGRNDRGQADAPAGTFTMVDVFDTGSCGLRTGGGIVCWGEVGAPAPAGAYRQLSIGFPIGVALDASGSATAWEASGTISFEALPEARPGPFESISAGRAWVCGVKTDASLFCWEPGFPENDKVYAEWTPAGPFTAVSVGQDDACALQPDGHPVCFGRFLGRPVHTVPDATFTQISTGAGFACGITTEQGLLCWGDNHYGESTPPT